MPIFASEKVAAINAKEPVEQLIVDSVGQLDVFEADLEEQYKSELKTILSYIEHAANGNILPATKGKVLRGGKKGVTEYEFKSDHLRVYAIQRPGKKLIVMGGYKNTQEKDITAFRSLTDKYLETQKSE